MIVTGAWFLSIALGLTVMNPPQCPDNYTQAQVDASNCIIGANIGIGFYVMFVILPLSIAVLVLWATTLSGRVLKKHGKTTKKEE